QHPLALPQPRRLGRTGRARLPGGLVAAAPSGHPKHDRSGPAGACGGTDPRPDDPTPLGRPARTARLRARVIPAAAVLADVTQTVSSGSLLLALPICVAAGAVSFLSPCVLP